MSNHSADPKPPHTSSETVIRLYENHADLWLALRGKTFAEGPWLDLFYNSISVSQPSVLDLGCGSGAPIDDYLIEKGCRITGVDGSSALIAHAQTRHPRHIWITADMRQLPTLDPFRGVIAWHSLFHLSPDDRRSMFTTFSRLCRKDGVLLFTTGPAHGEAIGTFAGEALYHASLDSEEYRELLKVNGFDILRHVVSDPTCGEATVWLARKVRTMG